MKYYDDETIYKAGFADIAAILFCIFAEISFCQYAIWIPKIKADPSIEYFPSDWLIAGGVSVALFALILSAKIVVSIKRYQKIKEKNQRKIGFFDFFQLFIILTGLIFFSSTIIGGSFGNTSLIIAGIGIVLLLFFTLSFIYFVHIMNKLGDEWESNTEERTAEKEEKLLNAVNSAKDREKSLLARARYYVNAGEETVKNAPKNRIPRAFYYAKHVFLTALGFGETTRKALKKSSAKTKLAVALIIISILALLFTGLLGVLLAALGMKSGFILLGIGYGGFALFIVSLFLVSLNQRRRQKMYMSGAIDLGEYEIHTGAVRQCNVHSQHSAGTKTPRITGTIYQVNVEPAEKGPAFWATSDKYYKKGESVEYYEHKKHPNRRIIK